MQTIDYRVKVTKGSILPIFIIPDAERGTLFRKVGAPQQRLGASGPMIADIL